MRYFLSKSILRNLYPRSAFISIIGWVLGCILFTFINSFQLAAQTRTKYIFINTWTKWRVDRPASFNRQIIDVINQEIDAPKNGKVHLGISYTFDYLRTNLDSVEKSLGNFLALSKQTQIPILINLDGQNWWEGRPDLWNWWDPTKPGYNPENRKNVEWTDWTEESAIKISWRNWGKQLRVLPAPNIASPAVLAAHEQALKRLIPMIITWYRKLPANQKYLLGGVKVGWEASVGVNAYYYKDGHRYLELQPRNQELDPRDSFRADAGLSAGLMQLGYAAVKTAGIKSQGKITRDDIGKVVGQYLTFLSKTAYDLGVPRDLLFTHQGGTFDPWEKHLSFGEATNKYATPGWSFYTTDPATAGDLPSVLAQLPQPGWAAVEWWWPGQNKLEWVNHLQRTLSYNDCRFLVIFNWEDMLEKSPDGIAAVREVLENGEN